MLTAIRRAVEATRVPAVVNDLQRGQIMACNAPARTLLGKDTCRARVTLGQVLDWDPQHGLDLLASGEIDSYEKQCRVRATDMPVLLHMRVLSTTQPHLAVTLFDRRRSGQADPPSGQPTAIGTADASMIIRDIVFYSAEALATQERTLVGVALPDIVVHADQTRLLAAVTATHQIPQGEPDRLIFRLSSRLFCSSVLLVARSTVDERLFLFTIVATRSAPLGPALMPVSDPGAEHTDRPVAGSEASTAAPDPQWLQANLDRLAPREAQVVQDLLRGYRSPAIAQRLFLSPGTVRNHLSAAYRKLGVANQQQLIDLLRHKQQ